jgi:predicted MFS family arabinose efflux permease
MSDEAAAHPRRALRRELGCAWGIGLLAGLARWSEFIAFGLFAYQVTRSPSLVALLSIVRMAPYVLFGALIGAIADRLARKGMLIAGLLATTAASATAAFQVSADMRGLWVVAGMTAVSGLFWVLDLPVRRHLLVDAAGEGRVAANALDNATGYGARAAGVALGGIAYQHIGIDGTLLVHAVVYAACLGLALRLRVPRPAGPAARARSGRGRLGGILPPAEMFRRGGYVVMLGLASVFNLCCLPLTAMVPVIAQRELAMEPAAIGMMAATEGLGGLIGSLLVARFGSPRTLFAFHYSGLALFVLLMVALAANLTPAAAALGLLFTGLATACYAATQYPLLHLISPPEARGRAAGTLSACFGLSVVGFWVAGLLFDRLPATAALALLAAAGAAPLAWLGLLWRRRSRAQIADAADGDGQHAGGERKGERAMLG